jgi:hypothetical protein
MDLRRGFELKRRSMTGNRALQLAVSHPFCWSLSAITGQGFAYRPRVSTKSEPDRVKRYSTWRGGPYLAGGDQHRFRQRSGADDLAGRGREENGGICLVPTSEANASAAIALRA